jgi:thiamine transport system permease protein
MERSGVALIGRVARALPYAFVAACGLIPLLAVLHASWRGGAGTDAWPHLAAVLGFSLWQAALSTTLALAAGLPLAWLLARFRVPGRRVMRALVLLPFVMPTVVTAAGFVATLGPRGPLAELWREFGGTWPTVIPSLGAVLLAHVFYNYGVVVQIVGGAWRALGPRPAEAAALLGATPWQVFSRVTVPLLWPAVASAALLVFIYTFGSFGVIVFLGGARMATVEVEIWRQTAQLLRLDLAATLALLQLGVTTLATAGYTWLTGRVAPQTPQVSPEAPPPRRRREWLAVAAGWSLVLAFSLPLLALVLRSFAPLQRGATGLSLAAWQLLGENPRGSYFFVPPAQAIGNSLLITAVASTLALALGVLAAYSLRTPARRAWREALLMLPLGISAVTLGLGFVLVFGPLGRLRDLWLIPVAHALLAFPLVLRSLAPALRNLDPRLREAATLLGATPWRAVWRVELPLLRGALIAGAALAAAVSLGDYGAALLLGRPDAPTIPLVIGRLLGQPGAANYAQALALASILLLLAGACALLVDRDER